MDSIVLEIDQYFKSIISTIETSLSKMEIQDQWPHSLLETRNLFGAIEIMISNSINHAADSKIAKIASQVSHDIRSPLAALEMINSNLSELPEDKRSIIKNSINRIRDIANDLLYERSKNSSNTTTPNDIVTSNIVETQCIHLYPLIDSIVSEKRIQYRGLIDIEIDFIYNNDIYGMFANLNTKDIKRALSNLINNAVESIENKSGKVIISLNSTENDLQISIVDTGKGMSPELLSKIGTVSFTHGKNNGNGIGIIQSIEAIKNSNGTFEIFSEINKGTEIKIKFKKAKEPVWFIPELVVTDSHKILVLDDDVTIHQVWVQRFKEIFKINDFEIFHFSNLKDFKKYYGVNFAELDEALFLIDYEISNNQQTGLDLIFELGINSQSVLVTSRYDENSIIQACENANVRLLPKLLSTSIPIKIENKSH